MLTFRPKRMMLVTKLFLLSFSFVVLHVVLHLLSSLACFVLFCFVTFSEEGSAKNRSPVKSDEKSEKQTCEWFSDGILRIEVNGKAPED